MHIAGAPHVQQVLPGTHRDNNSSSAVQDAGEHMDVDDGDHGDNGHESTSVQTGMQAMPAGSGNEEGKETAVEYVARNCGSLTIFKLDLRYARTNCSHVSSGKGAEAKGMVYTSVLQHGGIVMQCANGSTYPEGVCAGAKTLHGWAGSVVPNAR